jgi:hypothetical protein
MRGFIMAGTKEGKYVQGGIRITKNYMGVAEKTALANNEVLNTSIGMNRGLLIVADMTNQKVILLRIEGSTMVSVSGNAIFTITKDTASKINVYWETDQVKVQNKTGGILGIKVALSGI